MNVTNRLRLYALVCGLCFLGAACSASREVSREEPATPPPTVEEAPHEEAPRAEAPPEPPPAPETEARKPVPRTVRGFRIQIVTTDEKQVADTYVGEAITWWDTLSPAERRAFLSGSAVDVDIMWKQPYYRVRLGGFTSRSEAQDALAIVKTRFPEAFLVPDLVRLTR